jgi:hypothetical protein
MRTYDPNTPRTIQNGKQVLRAMVKRSNKTQLAAATGIEREQLISFGRGGELSGLDLKQLCGPLLRGQIQYHEDTDTLTATEGR